MPHGIIPKQPTNKGLDKTLQQALGLHHQGQYQAAQTLYKTILKQLPNHIDALQLYGTAALQQQDLATAERYLKQALKLRPNLLNPTVNLVHALEGLGKIEEAIQYLGQVIQLDARPDFYLHRATLYQKQQAYAQAAEDYEKITLLQSQNWSAYLNAGECWQANQNYPRALAIYEKAIQAKPDFLEAWVNHAIALQALDRFDEALRAYDRALAINPNFHVTYFNQGVLFDKLQRYEDAITAYTKVLELEPKFVDALCNRGNTWLTLKQLDKAEQDYQAALQLTPHNHRVLSNLGIIYKNRQQYPQAIELYKQAINAYPQFVDAYCNLGNALCLIGEHEAARRCYQSGLQIEPNHTEIAWSLSLALLRRGDFQQGWPLYERRWMRHQAEIVRLHCKQPQWMGEPLQDKTIFLHWEQGLGDTLQFCQLIRIIKLLGAKIMMAVQPPLERLLQYNLKDVDIWITELTQVPEFDYYIHLLSLPTALKLSLSQLPAMQNYIRAEPEYIEKWQQKLGTTSKPRIGLVWQGGQQHKETHLRNLSLQKLLPHLSTDYEFIVLQKEVSEEDQEILKHQKHLSFYGDEIKDFSDTAALCHLSDCIISIDTSVAHLAGAMGKPCYLVLPFCPDFRWLLDRHDTPWYPSLQLFRQQQVGDWESALHSLFQSLSTQFKHAHQ